jgi:O-antigen ligase
MIIPKENSPPAPDVTDPGSRIVLTGFFLFALLCSFSISGAQIALGISFLGLLWQMKKGHLQPRPSFLEVPFAGFALAGLLSIGNAVDTMRAIFEMKKFLILLVFWTGFWPAISRENKRRVLGAMIFSGALASIIGLIKLFHFDTELLRAYGFFSLPITFGEVLALLSLLSLGWIAGKESSPVVRMGLLLAFFLMGTGLLMTFSRGAWMGFGAGFLVLLYHHRRLFWPLALLLLAGLIAGAILSSGVRNRIASFNFDENFFRFRIWQLGFDILETNPVFGVGMNNVKPLYRTRVRALDLQRGEVHGHLHNTFMQILVMTGLFGFLCFCWLWAEITRFIFFQADQERDPWQKNMTFTAWPILVCFLVTGLTEYSFGDEEVAMLFFFLLGFLTNQNPNQDQETISPPRESLVFQGSTSPTPAN